MTKGTGREKKAQFGVIGLAVMGKNLALNIVEKGFTTAVWTKSIEKVDQFIGEQKGKGFIGAKTLEDFVSSIEPPRMILLMIKSGPPVDETLDRLVPLLSKGDVVIDGGNSWFEDTRRREAALGEAGIHFVGMGVSGGEEGARHGPSLMPGGSVESYHRLKPVLEAIAAKAESGPCVTHVGPDGAGHFVKMVHNGIEYGDMQLIAEAYSILKIALGLEPFEMAGIFSQWNQGPLQSFLIEITAGILSVKDEDTGKPLINLVLDSAGQKGTGRWTAHVALDLGVPVPTISASLFARAISSMKDERRVASSRIKGPGSARSGKDRKELIGSLHDALYAAKALLYAQGISLIRAGSDEYNWDIELKETARIWKGGCIIRARFLDSIMAAYERNPALANLLLDDEIKSRVEEAQERLRSVVGDAQRLGIAVPAMGSSLAYFDSYRAAELPQNLTQAQRDAFGAHTYRRVDHPRQGPYHTDWLKLSRKK